MLLAELPVPRTGARQADEAADRILARREFGGGETWLTRARDWVFERIGDLFEQILGAGGGGLAAVVVAVVLAALAVVVAVRSTRDLRQGRRPDEVAPAGLRPAVDWRADAAANEAAGDWRAALRCRYRALVADLAARGLVDEVPGRTAGEYRREVGASVPAAAGDFDGATALFEAAWYGNRPTGPDEAQRFRAHERRVLTGAGA